MLGSAITSSAFLAVILGCVAMAAGASQQPGPAQAEQHSDHQHNMTLDNGGVVMNSNTDVLPRDCKQFGPDYEFTVSAGTEFATDNPGTVYGYSQHEFLVEPCSRVTITLVNKDQVRHQWMIHGLPRYLYPGGMFHLEAAGGHSRTGTFIVPSDHQTYLVHCDVAQHMEKGMKGQLKVGRGSGDLWSIPGVSGNFFADAYVPEEIVWYVGLSAIAAFLLTTLLLLRKQFF